MSLSYTLSLVFCLMRPCCDVATLLQRDQESRWRFGFFMIATVPSFVTNVADHAALSQAKKIRRSRSRPYSEHGRPELATETPEKPQSHGNMGGRQPAVIARYLHQSCQASTTIIPPASRLLNWFDHAVQQSPSVRLLIAGSCPFLLLCSQTSKPLRSGLQTSQEQKNNFVSPPTKQQQITLVFIHRAPAASRGFFTLFLCQGPLQHPQLGTAPPQENVAGTQHNPPGITPCIITHWDRSTNTLISTQNTTGQIRSEASAVIALFGQPPSPPSRPFLWGLLPQFLGPSCKISRRNTSRCLSDYDSCS
ncbi:hypothetical protein LA080_001143 [Diaporthe eres]|nr:hypothetical protein LA080_001143 [Diaporthe eres]